MPWTMVGPLHFLPVSLDMASLSVLSFLNLAQAKQLKVYEVQWTWDVKRPPTLDQPTS